MSDCIDGGGVGEMVLSSRYLSLGEVGEQRANALWWYLRMGMHFCLAHTKYERITLNRIGNIGPGATTVTAETDKQV